MGVLDVLLGPPLRAVEGQHEQPGHVERGEPARAARPAESQPGQPARSKAAAMIGSLVKKPDSGGMPMMASQPSPRWCPGDLHVLPQPTEAADVDLVVHAVHDRAGAEEQAGLEEAVRQQVDQARAYATPPSPTPRNM